MEVGQYWTSLTPSTCPYGQPTPDCLAGQNFIRHLRLPLRTVSFTHLWFSGEVFQVREREMYRMRGRKGGKEEGDIDLIKRWRMQ